MSDIVLLMTGVLMAKQPSPSYLSQQPVIQLDNGVHITPQGQISQSNLDASNTPPEFMQLKENSPATLVAFNSEPQKTLVNNTEKKPTKDLYSVSEFNNLQPVKLKFPRSQSLIAQQVNDDPLLVASYQISTGRTLPSLRFGNSGLAVRVLQRLLIVKGYPIRLDGVYGAVTESAVKAFQSRQNLTADGVVGPRTWLYLTR
ncbi:peptidoglycan-binding protein [Nostoc sp. FACHB-152]|uniref:peptidoglycan-binding domain-containing protein n=1 Tax=unclassified Nostoc TaxID=2593658 RepID=UPI001682CE9C|nr:MULTISPECIES: peptidoglycan-binding domain-containing protein [unclassified Nostoc]MBD2448156.1 peptidoglycan-binding protein [Nostoc sp. FACHB-152]MBD2470567.1 peptidoglycan-binding protein [Nostoc sp. FACHB-145]